MVFVTVYSSVGTLFLGKCLSAYSLFIYFFSNVLCRRFAVHAGEHGEDRSWCCGNWHQRVERGASFQEHFQRSTGALAFTHSPPKSAPPSASAAARRWYIGAQEDCSMAESASMPADSSGGHLRSVFHRCAHRCARAVTPAASSGCLPFAQASSESSDLSVGTRQGCQRP